MSVLKDIHGPDWPLGFIEVPVPGTIVSIMSLVDPASVNDPSTPPSFPPATNQQEYTVRCQQMILSGFKPDSGTMIANTGLVFLVRKGGSRADPGSIVAIIQPGQQLFFSTSALVKDAFSPYRYFLDADTANDGALVTLLIF